MRQWLKDVFSGSSAASFGRIAAGVVILWGLGAGTYVLISTHPPKMPDLGSVTALAGTIFGASKALEKGAEVLKAKFGNGGQTP